MTASVTLTSNYLRGLVVGSGDAVALGGNGAPFILFRPRRRTGWGKLNKWGAQAAVTWEASRLATKMLLS